jgi:excisionase family DNA binding protein
MTDAETAVHRFYTVAAIAALLCVCTRTVRNWIDRGELQAHRPGGRQFRISEADLHLFLEQRRK